MSVTIAAINANGWIVGWGENDSDTVAFLLIPVDDYKANWCAADIANATSQCPDGAVEVFDLLALLANWGTAGPGADIASPMDTVNVFDLLGMLEQWGCGIGGNGTTLSLEDQLDAAGLTTDDFNEYTDVMLNEEDEKVKANYNCWFENYMTGCSTCPPCPGEDPFD